jgi:microcystin-dependent protein
LSATGNISFSDSLNNVSATVFGFLSGVTSSIQDQFNEVYLNIYTYFPNNITFSINQLKNQIAPPGSIITFAGTATSLDGYFLCDGSSYNSSNQSNLFEAIGYTYGGSNGIFKVPNYKGIFLRGNGSQDVQLRVIAGGGGPIIKQYTSPSLGTTVIDQSTYFETSNYVDSISTTSKTVVTGMSPNLATLSTTSVIGSVNYSTTNNFYNLGNEENHPVHASVQYFIKY